MKCVCGRNILTKAQKKVFDLVLKGHSNYEIGELLGIKEKSVRWHLTAIYDILQVKNRVHMILKYGVNK